MKNLKLFILCGEAFSGKSTLAKEIAQRYGAKIVGRDETYFAIEKMLELEQTPDEDDYALWSALWPLTIQGVKNHLMLGHSVVFDDNCFKFSQREELRVIAKNAGAESALIYCDVPIEVLKQRKEANKISKQRHDVPSAWLDDNAKDFERPTEAEKPFVYREGMKLDEIVFDENL